MSLFVAVRPDRAAHEDLADALHAVRRSAVARDVRWQPPEQWHVTLAFLGDPPDDRTEDVAERLDALGAEEPVASIVLAGAGSFGRQVLWVGLAEGTGRDRLGDVATRVPRLLRGTGVSTDRRPWSPHLTIGRVRGGDVRPVVPLLAGYLGPPWPVDEVLLVRSSGGPHPVHRIEHTVRLQGRTIGSPS